MKTKILFFLLVFSVLKNTAQAQLQSHFSWKELPVVAKPVFKKDTLNILEYGAVNDGITLNTEAINKAIVTTSKKGGGVVLVPSGLWLSGPIDMKSNVNLHLSVGATLSFTTDKTKYLLVEGDYEGKSAARNESPINGKNLENIAITGKGIIDGNGDAWRAVGQSQLTAAQWNDKLASGGVLSDDHKTWYPSQQFKDAQQGNKSMLLLKDKNLSDFADMKDFLRPNLVVFKNCKQVLIEDVTLQNSPAWCLHPLMCEDLTISGVKIKNPHYAQNGDGIDIESCKRFVVENSVLDVGDDAICIKSGKDEEGRRRGMPSEQGIIRGNIVYSGHGGVVIGSEMSGGARDIFIENCTFIGTDKGLRFKSTRGRGGIVEHIFARNIAMKDIVQEAIFFDMFYFVKFATDGKRDETPTINEGTPIFRNMVFENIVCNGAKTAFFVRGLTEMKIQNITLSHSTFNTDNAVSLIDVMGIKIDDVKFFTDQKQPLISIVNGADISLDKVSYDEGSTSFLLVDGKQSENIKVLNTKIGSQEKNIIYKNGVKGNVVLYN